MFNMGKREENGKAKIWISCEVKESFLDKIKAIFHEYLGTTIWWKNEKQWAQALTKRFESFFHELLLSLHYYFYF